MASDIVLAFQANPRVTKLDIRNALATLTEDDLTVKSPVTAGIPEAGISIEETDEDHDLVYVRVQGHSGDWSKTSQDAVFKAVLSADHVEKGRKLEGGYTPDE